MTNPKALTDLASYMVEALKNLTDEERLSIFVAQANKYCLLCGKADDPFNCDCCQ